MVRPEKLATPATAACVGDPDSVPPPALFPMASVTFAANPVAVLPKLSRAVTWMAGIAAPAGVFGLAGEDQSLRDGGRGRGRGARPGEWRAAEGGARLQRVSRARGRG